MTLHNYINMLHICVTLEYAAANCEEYDCLISVNYAQWMYNLNYIVEDPVGW